MAHDLQMLLRPEDERTRICTASKAEVAYPVAFLLQMTMYNMEERCRSTRIYSFILTVLFDMYSTPQFHRPLSLSLSLSFSLSLSLQLPAVRPAKRLLVGVSSLIGCRCLR